MLTLSVIIIRLLCATMFCGIIGLEREIHGKPVGFRTAGLVGLGAALMTISGIYIYQLFPTSPADPSRIASIVVSGIGFIGAGAIIQSRGAIYGITTAASLWIAAGIGIAFGIGLYAPAIICSAIAIVVLWAFYFIDKLFLDPHKKKFTEGKKEEIKG